MHIGAWRVFDGLESLSSKTFDQALQASSPRNAGPRSGHLTSQVWTLHCLRRRRRAGCGNESSPRDDEEDDEGEYVHDRGSHGAGEHLQHRDPTGDEDAVEVPFGKVQIEQFADVGGAPRVLRHLAEL